MYDPETQKRNVSLDPQIRALGDNLKEGDVILSNNPCAGGSHLPDLTVITPVSAALHHVFCSLCLFVVVCLFVPFVCLPFSCYLFAFLLFDFPLLHPRCLGEV